jgi:PhnB protein
VNHTMADMMSIELSLFVEHGREREAADFYLAAFGAQELDTFSIEGALAGVRMQFGELSMTGAGSNPNRERMPSRGGPFFPKAAGEISAIAQLHTDDVGGILERAVAAGARIRGGLDTDSQGRQVATIFDPFNHIWALVSRQSQPASLTA